MNGTGRPDGGGPTSKTIEKQIADLSKEYDTNIVRRIEVNKMTKEWSPIAVALPGNPQLQRSVVWDSNVHSSKSQ